VIDLGCNLGLFAIEAARQGAAAATGIDIQEPVITAAGHIRDFLGCENCDFRAVDLLREEARDAIEPADVVFAFAVYDHLTGRHKRVHPAERETSYLDITEWLARITRETLIVEFHNRQAQWAGFFRGLLLEHGFEVVAEKVTPIERPVFFCRRTSQRHDELVIRGVRFHRLRRWSKRHRRLYILEQAGRRFLCKRYASAEIARGVRPADEASVLGEFADCPEVLQPFSTDEQRIVIPYFDGRPLDVIDAQPGEAARLTPALRLRVLAALSRLLALYFERRGALFARLRDAIPEVYRAEVESGERLLIDVSPSNILVSAEGGIRFVDFEPSKPALTRNVIDHLRSLAALSGERTGILGKLRGRR
jgi:SAM-dependent methyltransferase